jgi:hypothetical protein
LLPFAAAAQVIDLASLLPLLGGLILKCQPPEPCWGVLRIPGVPDSIVARFTVKKTLTVASRKSLTLKCQRVISRAVTLL